MIDYGVGNVASLCRALEVAGARAELTSDPRELRNADAIALPGVGHFGHCATEFGRAGFRAPLLEARAAGIPILGICVGMQLLFEGSEEAADRPGIGLLRGRVSRMREPDRLPQIGWSAVSVKRPHRWLRGVPDGDLFYFIHSYAADAGGDAVLATVDLSGERAAIVGDEGVLGVQFHPERSGAAGIRLLRGFVEAVS